MRVPQSPSLRTFADYLFNVSTFHFHKLYQRQRFFKSTQIKPSLHRPPFQRGYIITTSGGVIVINTENQGPFHLFLFYSQHPGLSLLPPACVDIPNQAHLHAQRKGRKYPKRAIVPTLFPVGHYYVYMPDSLLHR